VFISLRFFLSAVDAAIIIKKQKSNKVLASSEILYAHNLAGWNKVSLLFFLHSLLSKDSRRRWWWAIIISDQFDQQNKKKSNIHYVVVIIVAVAMIIRFSNEQIL
jgi:hypothetical protein